MFEGLKKTFEKGKDYAFETRDKIEKAAKEFAAENNLTKEEAKKLVDQWVKKADETRKGLEKQITEMQKTAIAKMNLVTKEDLKKLEDRIKKLEKGHKAPARAKAVVKPRQ
jgi:polyhydroxyalkanoate synthesis regulator phasin